MAQTLQIVPIYEMEDRQFWEDGISVALNSCWMGWFCRIFSCFSFFPNCTFAFILYIHYYTQFNVFTCNISKAPSCTDEMFERLLQCLAMWSFRELVLSMYFGCTSQQHVCFALFLCLSYQSKVAC